MAEIEEYFPRGGKKPTAPRFKQSINFLGAPDVGEKKKKKQKKKNEADDGYLSDDGAKDLSASVKNCTYGLSYKTVKPDTLILGRVRQVLETKVNVMLPCRMMGSVMACHISEPYNKLLEAYVNDEIDKVCELSEMFRPGQYVALKVLETNKDHLILSMMPQHVNGGKRHADLHTGCLLQAAVSSVEDHGYVMDIGLPNTRAFLPKKHANPEVALDTGSIAWVAVKSVSSESSVVTLTGELSALEAGVQRKKQATPLLPATAVDFTVDRPLENGIEGHIFGDTTAYIQQQHADTVRGKKPALGQRIRARILYVKPTSNTPFLTMRNIFASTFPDMENEQTLREGDIVESAQVLKIVGRSIRFKLGRGSFGTMSLKRIQVDENLTDEEVVAKSYPVGSNHKVRILFYNLSDYNYNVTDEPSVVGEKYFSLSQLTVGEFVSGNVREVTESSVTVNVGRLTGYVPQAHLADSGVYVDPKKASKSKLTKKKFKVGQEVTARVLSLDLTKQSLLLTLKPSLLAEDLQVLSSYEDAKIGSAYTGVIKLIRDYVLISFFNNVVAYVRKQHVTKEPIDNLSEAFHVGQIVNCTILKVDVENKKLLGSLVTAPFVPSVKKNKPEKRKQNASTEATPSKKRKSSETETDDSIASKKDRRKEKETSKRMKKDSDDIEEIKVSEESDAIETDVQEDPLTPHEMGLVDLSDCHTAKQFKKRIVSLLKAVQSRTRRLDRIEKKIQHIEEKGLTPKNKKFHTAMHMEKLGLQDRIQTLIGTLTTAQTKLKEFGVDTDEVKSKREGKSEKEVVRAREKKREVAVVESLVPALDVPSAKDFWAPSAQIDAKDDEASSSSEDEQQEQPRKKRKKLSVAEKTAKAREEEERLREMERRAVESEAEPRSSEQFERALLATPDSSQLWIAYMAFHLQATEIEKARAVGRKALKTISFREEGERLNVWLALLNCEHRFGTKESQQSTLEEALQMNDPLTIHTKLLDILVETGKTEEVTTLVDLMSRKYKRSQDMYLAAGRACFSLGLVDKARGLMQKAVTLLEKKEHVTILVQFALLERQYGAAERAEALFEQVLAIYPQRVDVCSVYVDMLVKSGDVDRVRQVLERMTSQKLPARKMKVLYKKWIEAEERIGDPQRVEAIQQKAMEYIDKAKF